jgi:hypothetical protein
VCGDSVQTVKQFFFFFFLKIIFVIGQNNEKGQLTAHTLFAVESILWSFGLILIITEANGSHECASGKSTAPESPEYLSHFTLTQLHLGSGGQCAASFLENQIIQLFKDSCSVTRNYIPYSSL